MAYDKAVDSAQLDANLTSVADAIRAKGGTDAQLAFPSGFVSAVEAISGAEAISWHQCPELVRNYLAAVTYDPSDYSTSQIANYAPATAVESNYRPIGAEAGAETYYNQEPGVQTPFANSEKAGTLKPLDQVRWIKTTAPNVRDLGGWACDGGTVKYGLLFRGGFLGAGDRAALVGELGVMHDLDLRGASEAGGWTASPLGDDIYYTCATNYAWYALTPGATWKLNLRTVFDAVIHGEPVYFHCSAGADRTGTLACVLEGLLGMSQSDIDKDYELTSFYSGTETDAKARRRNESEWQGLITAINAKSGTTFRDKCVTFAAELGFTAAEINAFRAAMIDGTPETVTPSISTYAVTNSLTDVTSDNSAASATQYQPYEANIAPAAGKVIGSIKITMGGADITPTAFSGTRDVLRRAITQTLTACTSSNPRIYAIDGQSYVTTLTANEGYDISSVTITMGGIDVSKYYKDGVISIPNVTGDIIITATAVVQAPSYTNQIPLSIGSDGQPFNGGSGFMVGKRWSSSSGTAVDNSGSFITGFIPVKDGDVIRFSGSFIEGTGATIDSFLAKADFSLYSAQLNGVYSGPINGYHFFSDAYASKDDFAALYSAELDSVNQKVLSLTIPSGANAKGISYMCFGFSGGADEAANAVITVNEEIS